MRRSIPLFLLFFLASLLLILADSQGFLRPVKRVAESASLPVQKSFYSFRLRFFSPQKDETDLSLQLEQAKHEITSLKAQVSSLKEENQAMRRLLSAPLPSSWQFLPAKVVGEEGGILKIDKGQIDEVGKMPTVVVDGVFVGRVSRVSEVFSLVETPKASGFKIQAVARQEGKEGILARGLLVSSEGKIFLDKVLQEEEIREGDMVLTSGEGGLAPDIPIGKIVKVILAKGGIYKKGEVEPFFKEKALEVVFLVKVR